jgi:hypothetical protein
MSESSFRKFYGYAEFLALSTGLIPDPEQLTAFLATYGFSVVPTFAAAIGGDTIVVEWETFPAQTDLPLLDAAIAEFTGGVTRQLFVAESFAAATSNSTTPVVKIDQTTPPLEGGTYLVCWASSLRMATAAANAGVQARVRLERSDGQFVEQTDAWDLTVNHAFNGAQPFAILPGQTIHASVSFNRLGSAGVAELSGARITAQRTGD